MIGKLTEVKSNEDLADELVKGLEIKDGGWSKRKILAVLERCKWVI